MHRGCHHHRRRARTGTRSHRGEPGLTRTVSLLVPGLAADFGGYTPAALPPAAALSLWLTRAAASAFPGNWCEQAIDRLCGSDDARAPAVAAVTYREDFGETPSGWCLRADPVHLRADSSGLILFDAASFALGADESRALVDTLAGHLAEDNWQLACRHPQRWYLLGDRKQQLETSPLPVVRGTPVPATPLGGKDAVGWMGRLNELQMLMHSHPVNQQRAGRGQPAVNSVWLWGGGERPVAPVPPYTGIVSDNVFARGVAGEAGVPALNLPADAAHLLAALHAGGHMLVVLEQCRDAAAYEEIAVWQAALEALERDWFAPLVTALRQHRVDALQLYALNGSCYRLTRARLRAFWKGAGDYRRQPGFRQRTANRV